MRQLTNTLTGEGRFLRVPSLALIGVSLMFSVAPADGQVSVFTTVATVTNTVLDNAAEKARAAKIIGPEKAENNCASCHELEAETWRNTHHFASFKDRHRSDRGKEILRNLGQRSMKRGATNRCRQCHYTSTLKRDRVLPTWGVSCESCHSPAKEWNDIHAKVGGDPSAKTLKWGDGRTESTAQRLVRLGAARAKGLVHSQMIYEIATTCFGCHAAPNERLVNDGDHKAGSSDFDLVAWSQGEIRHNFVSSPGAPDKPTNQLATPEQRRRLYVVGAMVDLEFSLRNLANVKQKGGAFHLAMIERVNRIRTKVEAILKAVDVPELAAALKGVPEDVDTSTSISPDLLKKLSEASQQFVKQYDGTRLGAIDSQIPTETKGEVHRK